MKISLHWKITFIFCSIFILALLSGYFYLSHKLTFYFENSLQESLRRELMLGKDLLEVSLGPAGSGGNIGDADMLARKIGKELGLRATIVALDGTVIGDNSLNKDQIAKLENHADRPEIQDAIKKGFGVGKRYSYTIRKYMLYMATPFGKPRPAGILRLSISLEDIASLEAQLQKTVIFTVFFVFLFCLGVTFIISIFVSRPLIEMSKITRALAGGDFTKKPSIYSKDEIGRLARAIGDMSDEIKDKMEKIKSESRKLDIVLSSMFEGVIVTDKAGIIILMNPALRKLFFVEHDPIGRRPLEVIRNTAVQDIVDRILQDKQRLATEEISVSLPEEKILKINGAAIIRNDNLEGAVLVFHDISELRRLEKMRQDFVANVSHELRTPVSSIKGYAETLLEGAIEDKENARDFVSIIHQDSDRLAKLIDDLLDLSKIESGKMKMAFLPVDPATLIKRTVSVIENQAKEKNISLKLDLPVLLPVIQADETRFCQVMINLLDNAVKYTPDNGTVAISAGVKEKFLQVDIIDTGIGIPEQDISRIFERFYRVDKGRSRELGGTGLGLSIVKHIVQAHGGQVWLKSELGQGSTFSFTIPLA